MDSDFKKIFKQSKKEVDNIIKNISQKRGEKIYGPLQEAMEYSLFTGGKRVRPVIVKWVAELGKPDREILNKTLTAIEYIHTYSLIHDDLPALDDDKYRRGKLTAHEKFGEAMAVLAGDALLTEAFSLLASTGKIELGRILSDAAGPLGMVGGQAVDIDGNKNYDINYINNLKTARLFEAAAGLGAEVGELNDNSRKKLRNYGVNLGRAFQLRDDILDRESKNKDKTINRARNLIEEAKKQLEDLGKPERTAPLWELAEFVIKRDK
ncbi:MAG: polyprenyl synthetase family protein [Elusimicrobiota bacterium]